MKNILHICAGWEKWNGAANIARLIMGEQSREGHNVSFATWASISRLRSADEVWIHCSWKPCLWWAALWGKNVHWMPECSYDPIRRAYHGWKKTLVGPIERFSLRRAKALVATCEAEADWIRSYLGRHCPPIIITDIKRFFNLDGKGCKEVKEHGPLHLLYLGRRHPLKGLSYLESALTTYYNMLSKPTSVSHSSEPHNTTYYNMLSKPQVVSVPSGQTSATYYNKCPVEFRAVSNAFGEELEKVWDWCDVLVLPTLSDNFGLVIAEALERGKRVITTDGAPAWDPSASATKDNPDGTYGGRLIYMRGYRDGTPEVRVNLLKSAIESLTCRS